MKTILNVRGKDDSCEYLDRISCFLHLRLNQFGQSNCPSLKIRGDSFDCRALLLLNVF
jgi:hypothetical protein